MLGAHRAMILTKAFRDIGHRRRETSGYGRCDDAVFFTLDLGRARDAASGTTTGAEGRRKAPLCVPERAGPASARASPE